MPRVSRDSFQQCVTIFVTHVRNIDDCQWVCRLDSERISSLEGCEFLAAPQNRKGAFKPPQVEQDLGRPAHSLAQNFQNGFFSGASG